MKLNTEPLQSDCFYHIYNRGINGENIFKENRNYAYFLRKYAEFMLPYVSTYAYCLLKNHFHLLVLTHSEEEIRQLDKNKASNKDISWILSNAFASFFQSYAQSINKGYERTGKLFDEPFRRILIDNDAYFTEMIQYIHFNPQKHGFVKNFKDYPHSSYHAHLRTSPTKLKREEVISWFGSKEAFEKFHEDNKPLDNLDKFDIEFD
ncbi:MAG: hypothetical protein NW226_00510 [Microscillaceae bacterium]|nr:hypothetical protein [Microscillaceae bacterium]